MLPLWVWLLGGTPLPQTGPGDKAFRAGDLTRALVSWGQALEKARAQKKTPLQFELLLRIAAVHRRLGQVETAAKALNAAEQLASLPAHKGHLLLDRASNDLARGDLRAAEKGYAAAFKQLRTVKDPTGAATAALNLGTVRRARGNPDGASKALDAASTLLDALEDEGGRATVAWQRCRLAFDRGDLGVAGQLCQQGSELALSAKEMGLYVDIQLVRGEVFSALGRSNGALSLYRSALKLAEDRRDVLNQARLHNAIGGVLLQKGDGRSRAHLKLAEQAFLDAGHARSALQVAINLAMLDGGRSSIQKLVPRARSLGDRRLLATLLLNLAALGDDAALAKAGKLVDRIQHPDLVWRHRYLAGKHRLAADPTDPRGVEMLRQAVEELERRARQTTSKASARAFVTGHTEVYQALINAYTDRGDDQRAFIWARRLAAQDVPVPEDPALQQYVMREEDLIQRMESAQHEEQERELAKQLGALRVEFATAVDEMRSTVQDFDRMVRVDPEDLEAIQAQLPLGVTVLQPVLFSDQAVLMVLRRDHLKIVQVPLDGDRVQETVRRLSRSLQGRYLRDPAWTQGQAEKLGEWLLKPIEPYLEGTEVLVTSASGPLREVPFAMLRWDDRYTIERFAVAGVTNVASLSRKAPPFQLDPASVLLVGNPDGTLPGAEDEVGELAHRMLEATTLVGPQGTRDAVTDALRHKQVVHLATHGRIDRKRPTDSYLALAGGEHGKLSYQEIPGLAGMLSACRLVVLSACQSGVAVDAKDQGDGGIVVSINGLAAQFRRAGVETLVASLWSVDDEGTRRLMVGMYDELAAGANIAEALRRSQLAMLATDDFSHPWYWSSFVVVGDWR